MPAEEFANALGRGPKAFVGLLLLCPLAIAVWQFWPAPVPYRNLPDVAFVESEIAVNAAIAYQRLAEDLQVGLRQIPKFEAARVYEADRRVGVFDWTEEQRRYKALPPPTEPQDLYLAMGAVPWESEYFVRGERKPFHTSFIIHLERTGASRTRIGVLETSPRVTVGKKFRLIGRHLVPEWHTVRVKVEPTVSDRREVLELAVGIATRDAGYE